MLAEMREHGFPLRIHSRVALVQGFARQCCLVKDLADLDLDEQALIKKSRPWGWFAAGLCLLAVLGLGLGYAFPLQRAHALLVSEHEALAQKARELDQALGKATSSLSKTESERGGLEDKIDRVKDARQSLKTSIEVAAATVEQQVPGLVKSKAVQVTPSDERLDVFIQKKTVFLPRTTKLNPGIASNLCKMLAPLGKDKGLKLDLVVPVASEEKEPWKTAGEEAASLAQEVCERCETAADRVRAVASADPAMAGKVLFRFAPSAVPTLER
jgi:hypothetical protein